MDVNDLSSEGQRLVQDVRDIIDTARAIVSEKNSDELFQNFLWHTRAVDVSGAKQDPNNLAPVDKDKVNAEFNKRWPSAGLAKSHRMTFRCSIARKLLDDEPESVRKSLEDELEEMKAAEEVFAAQEVEGAEHPGADAQAT